VRRRSASAPSLANASATRRAFGKLCWTNTSPVVPSMTPTVAGVWTSASREPYRRASSVRTAAISPPSRYGSVNATRTARASVTDIPDMMMSVLLEISASILETTSAELLQTTGIELLEGMFESDSVRRFLTALPALNLFGDLLEPGQGALAWLWSLALRAAIAPASNQSLVKAMERAFVSAGGTLLRNTVAHEIVVEGGRCVGAVVSPFGSDQSETLWANGAVISNLGAGLTSRLLGEHAWARLDEWKTISGLDRKTDDALWKRYSAARETFNRRRGSHFAELDRERAGAREAKEKLCVKAEALVDSTDWGATSAEFRKLLLDWKAAGRAARDVDDALWARFKGAQDTFFKARNAVTAGSRAQRSRSAPTTWPIR